VPDGAGAELPAENRPHGNLIPDLSELTDVRR
jgi:hypothetical protein